MTSNRPNRVVLVIIILLAPLLMNSDSCNHSTGGTPPSPPPASGFTVRILDANSSGMTVLHQGGVISGIWSSDLSGAQGTVKSFPLTSQPVTVSNGRVPALWTGTYNPNDFQCLNPETFPNGDGWSTPITVVGGTVTVATCNTAAAIGTFALATSIPATLTIAGSGLTSSSGMPQLNLYDTNLKLISQTGATSVSTYGTSATFPFPKTSSNTSLGFGNYGFSVINQPVSGQYNNLGVGSVSIGRTQTLNSPFGIDAVDVSQHSRYCIIDGTFKHCTTTPTTITATPVITLYNSNQISYLGQITAVGTQPIAVKAYAATTTEAPDPDTDGILTRTGPSRAVVANFGSDTISVVDLNNRTVVKTLSVGAQPVAIALRPDETLAYVANYGDGTVSEISLSNLTVGRTTAVGGSPQTLSLDPGGSSLWVGGQGYMKQIDLGSFTVVNSLNVFGTVTSLGASQQQNALIYTVVNDGVTFATQGGSQAGRNASNYSVNELRLSDMTVPATYGTSTAAPYGAYTMNGTLPNSTLNPGATQVSSLWNNAMAASATPTGFIVYDMVNQVEILEGVTSTPVRGIASDPNNLMIFITTPDSNSFLTVPLPVH